MACSIQDTHVNLTRRIHKSPKVMIDQVTSAWGGIGRAYMGG